VIAKVEWHPGELYPRVGFIVTNMSRPAENVVAFYNKRGTCEQWIKEGKGAIKWTRLSCRSFAANAVRLTWITRRTRIALDRRPSQTQTAKAGRRGVGQQNGPHRLEADDHRRKLRCEIRAGHSGERGLEISQTRGATQLQPC
jgi:Transposase DDE domain group 1